MDGWAVRLFGEFSLRRHDHHAITELESRKAQELFCYLLLHRDQTHPREGLASLLWPAARPSQSKSYFRKALWQLQSALERAGDHMGQLIEVSPDVVRVSMHPHVWLDIAAFELAFASTRGKQGRELEPTEVEALRAGLDLYRGELLSGWYEEWCLYDRERLQHMYLNMLDKMMGYCEAHRRWDEGITYGSRILRFEPAQERTHQRLMRLHYLAGDRTAALRQFEQCAAALSRELDAQPDHDTVRLRNQIRSNSLPRGPVLFRAEAAEASAASGPLPVLLRRLTDFHATLLEMQQQVHENIEAVQRALDTDS